MAFYVRSANSRVANVAPPNGSCLRLCCLLPFAAVFVGGLYFTAFAQGPQLLDTIGAIDLDKEWAGTSSNPYSVLGVPKGSSPEIIRAMYGEKTKELKELCAAKSCSKKVKELQKAYDYVSTGASEVLNKRKAEVSKGRRSRDRDNLLADKLHGQQDKQWSDWVDHVTFEWAVAGNAVSNSWTQFQKRWDEDPSAEPQSKTEL